MSKAFLVVPLSVWLGQGLTIHHEAEQTQELLPPFELILGIRTDVECAKEPVRDPLMFGVRNLGGGKLGPFNILFRGKLHVITPDGGHLISDALGKWRTSEPGELMKGEVAIHPNCGSFDQYFEVRQRGRYLVWWTSMGTRSNVLVLDYVDSEFHRIP